MISINGMPATNERLGMLAADFSGLKALDDIMEKVVTRLAASSRVQMTAARVESGSMSSSEFDYWFSEEVRRGLGMVLGVVRAKAVAKAEAAGAGSASSAVLRRTYRKEYAVALHIAGNRKRISNKHRVVDAPSGGASGRRRTRSVSKRTKDIREYYGPDRSFILRFFEGGTDVRTAKNRVGVSGRGSGATYGARGAMGARSFFSGVHTDMEEAAQQLGRTLADNVRSWVETQFNEG